MAVAWLCALAVLSTGCRQLFGIDDTAVAGDAPAADASGGPDGPDATPGPDAGWVTLSFSQGVDGYAGTADTFIREQDPISSFGGNNAVEWFIQSGGEIHGLLQFADVFGAQPGQIPPGATIVTAALAVRITNAGSAPAGTIAEVAVPWTDTTTWDTLGPMPGVQPEDVGALVAPAPLGGTVSIDVTASATAWSADPTRNHGWIFSPAPGNGDRTAFASSESGNDHPLLTVTFRAP